MKGLGFYFKLLLGKFRMKGSEVYLRPLFDPLFPASKGLRDWGLSDVRSTNLRNPWNPNNDTSPGLGRKP